MLIVLAVIEFVLFIATIVTSAMQTDTVSMSRDLTYAVIGLVSALFGIFGAKQLDRGVLLLYFVLVVWGIASSTSNINSNFLEQSKQSDICTHELTQEAQDAEEEALGLQACTVQLALLTVKLVVIAINVVLQVISGWMALRLSEQIQEEEEGQEQQKQIQTNMDINFRRSSMMVGAGRRKGRCAPISAARCRISPSSPLPNDALSSDGVLIGSVMPFSAVPIPGVHPRVVSLRNCLPADACCDAVWLLGAVLLGGSLRSGNLAGLRLLAPSDGAYLFAPVSKWRRFATQTVCSNQPQQTSDDGEGGCGRPMRERGPMTPARRVWRTLGGGLLVSVVKTEKIAAMNEQIKKMDHELECYHKKLPKANVEFKNANEASDQAFAKSCVIESRQRFTQYLSSVHPAPHLEHIISSPTATHALLSRRTSRAPSPPGTSYPLNCSMAAFAEPLSAKRTVPQPREMPSAPTLTSANSGARSPKRSLSPSQVMSIGMLRTKIEHPLDTPKPPARGARAGRLSRGASKRTVRGRPPSSKPFIVSMPA